MTNTNKHLSLYTYANSILTVWSTVTTSRRWASIVWIVLCYNCKRKHTTQLVKTWFDLLQECRWCARCHCF